MKLYYAATSPYVRKVMACAITRGLEGRIQLHPSNPHASPADLVADNPTSKVPCLVTDAAHDYPDERRAAAEQANARYQAGLGNIDEVAEAQRLLTQGEIDDALARLGVWRGLLAVATAAGDIRPLVAEVSQ